jgi:hypothetical protein
MMITWYNMHLFKSCLPLLQQLFSNHKWENSIKPEYSIWESVIYALDCLCGLVVRVPGYRSRGSGFYSRHYPIFWEVVGLEWGPLSLVSTTEEVLGRNSSGSSLENREYGHGDPLRWPRDTFYLQMLALTLPTSGGRSVGLVLLQTKVTELFML